MIAISFAWLFYFGSFVNGSFCWILRKLDSRFRSVKSKISRGRSDDDDVQNVVLLTGIFESASCILLDKLV